MLLCVFFGGGRAAVSLGIAAELPDGAAVRSSVECLADEVARVDAGGARVVVSWVRLVGTILAAVEPRAVGLSDGAVGAAEHDATVYGSCVARFARRGFRIGRRFAVAIALCVAAAAKAYECEHGLRDELELVGGVGRNDEDENDEADLGGGVLVGGVVAQAGFALELREHLFVGHGIGHVFFFD